MAGTQDFSTFVDDFQRAAVSSFWATAASGDSTLALVTPSANGEVAATLTATDEVQNRYMTFGDVLCIGIDKLHSIEMGVKATAIAAAVQATFGLAGARNATINSLAQAAVFRMIGNDSVVIRTTDGTNTSADIATGVAMGTAYRKFLIDFTGGKSDVKFYIDGRRVAAANRFNLSAYTGSLQPFFQIQKTTGTAVGALTIDYVRIETIR